MLGDKTKVCALRRAALRKKDFMHWNSDDSFPPAEGGWASWRPPYGRRRSGERAVRRAIRQWHPLDPLLVSVPGALRLLPPICFDELAAALQRKTILQYSSLMVLMVMMGLGFTAAGFLLNDSFFLKVGAALALLFVFVLLQHIAIFRHLDRLRYYARFFAWTYLQPRANVIAMGSLFAIAGAIQWFLQTSTGSLFAMIERYGLVFDSAPEQPWRYLIGPFFHANLAHWAANASLLIVAAGLGNALGRALPIWTIFLFGTVVPGVVLTFLPHWIGSDAYFGISGGVFALYGWCIGIAFRNRLSFPFGFWWVVGYFAVATGITSSLLDPRASWFAHGFGLLTGIAAGLLAMGVKSDLESQPQTSAQTDRIRDPDIRR